MLGRLSDELLLSYVDESFDKKNFRLTALVVRAGAMRAFTHELDGVIFDAAKFGSRREVESGKLPLFEPSELHGHDLFHGKGEWEGLKSVPRARIAIYKQALEVVAQYVDAIYVQGVERAEFARHERAGVSIYAINLLVLAESLDRHAEDAGKPMLIVADQCDSEQHAHDHIWASQRNPSSGFRELAFIVDTVHFVPSHTSRLIQAADLVAFLHRRITDVVETDPRAERANQELWSTVSHLVVSDRMGLQ